ncbi:sigma-70 family RNA polymerase sigma factor [Plantactinospora sp. B5E13]|uniref:sigma-70 family RNA polymerase sigma factor n=1 Tax=Plantactinospora sp. B5E13 TaxID=3153758 RepID=UPI00325FD2C2
MNSQRWEWSGMIRPGRSYPDPGVVRAARAGDRHALDTLVAGSLPLVYNIVGRALRGHPDTDDVAQETLLRLVRHLAELRDPAAYRSWLVAITVRQVRDWQQAQRTGTPGGATTEVPDEVPDPAGDFAGLTILRLGLTDQRREVAEATRWLDPDDRELLALWWLEESGELDRADLAAGLGLPAGHVAVRVHRMKEQLDVARTVVRALRIRPGCPELATVTRGWDGVPTPLWRKRLARHVRECADCGRAGHDLLPVEGLLAGLPLLPVPPGLGERFKASAGAYAAPPRGLGRLFGTGARGVAGPVSAAAAVAGLVVAVLLAVQLSRPGEPETTALAGPDPAPGAAATTGGGPGPSPGVGTPTPSTGTPTPTATPSRRTSGRPAVPAAPPRTSEKTGVAVWNFPGVSQALANSGASWYYTWAAHHDGVSTPRGVQFVPMIWGRDHVTSANLARARSAGPYLLGFNEPDLAGQAEMSVEEALDLWPKLQATGSRLGSPAVAFGGDRPGGWLDRFMSGAKERGHRVDFIALHWYGGDFRTVNAVSQLRSYLQAVYERYRKPIWLTEFALIDFSSGQARFPSQQEQAAFVTAATKMLGGLSYLQRYAWFGLPATDKDRSGLFRRGDQPTAVGRAFQAAG